MRSGCGRHGDGGGACLDSDMTGGPDEVLYETTLFTAQGGVPHHSHAPVSRGCGASTSTGRGPAFLERVWAPAEDTSRR